jgi:hypothetical protein
LCFKNGEIKFLGVNRSESDTLPAVISLLWSQAMFSFTAERFALGECGHGYALRLTPNTQNLPMVLHTLNGTRGSVYQKLVMHMREIFSTVGNISVGPTENNNLEIRIWPSEKMDRLELSFPLKSSGTGVSQTIALLTAIMTVDNALIVIDEINSFLHPAAVKALLRILQTEYSHHQYIISTHAPEVIGFSNPKTVHLVKREGYNSSITKLDLNAVYHFREVAENSGVSMADVFAAERVVWVEGPTEELCFPLLYNHAASKPLPKGTIFTSVIATGDFLSKRRDRELIYKIYQRLAGAATPLVVSSAFSFDSEGLASEEKEKMVKESHGLMHFLPRRLIECYLISPEAIAKFINDRDDNDHKTDSDTISCTLVELAQSANFVIDEWAGDLKETAWLAKVDAAKLIAKTCEIASEYRVTFNKKDDTLSLVKYVQFLEPEQIEELSKYVQSLVDISVQMVK